MLLVNESGTMSTLDLLFKGGWLMVPLLLFSLIAVYIFIDRLVFIKSQPKLDQRFLGALSEKMKSGNFDEAANLCRSVNCSESRILLKGIESIGQPASDIKSKMESEGKLEAYEYEKNLYFLGVIAGIAPMMGFIGTILGVIKIFYNISLTDDISISVISGGLYQKLITSGVGLSIGIIAFIAYHFLNHMIDRIVQRWEFNSVRFIDLISKTSV